MGRLIGVFGSAGFGREVMSLVRRQHAAEDQTDELVFVVPAGEIGMTDLPIMEETTFLSSKRDRSFTIAIANGSVRERLHGLALGSGATPLDVRAASAEVLDDVTLGAGSVLCGHSSITSNTRVGVGFHLNISSYLAHDCWIGDFVTFGPNVVCAGNVVVNDGAYIGAGALIRQGHPGTPLTIGAGATVGMGAVVLKDVAPGSTVAGNPAREIRRG